LSAKTPSFGFKVWTQLGRLIKLANTNNPNRPRLRPARSNVLNRPIHLQLAQNMIADDSYPLASALVL